MTTKKEREEALRDVKMYQSNGWDLVEETPEFFLLKRNTQSLGVHIILLIFVWWSFGIANLLYWLSKRETKKIIK